MSRERGILFSAPMVRAILDSTKTQTRRAVMADACPYGAPGDRLWVRETWSIVDDAGRAFRGKTPKVSDIEVPGAKASVRYQAESGEGSLDFWRPSIFMPRWASRITLEITDVRVQRLHDISDADIRAEGVTAEAVAALLGGDFVSEPLVSVFDTVTPVEDLPLRELWRGGWTAINGEESWHANPWLWCLTFKWVQL